MRFVKSAQGAYSHGMPITRKSREIRRLQPVEPLLNQRSAYASRMDMLAYSHQCWREFLIELKQDEVRAP